MKTAQTEPLETRVCKLEGCNETFTVSKYGRNKRCCTQKHSQKHSSEESRLKCLIEYSNGKLECAVCGNKTVKALCVEHIEDNGKADREVHGKSGVFFSFLIREGYPPGYQVLCANCNHLKELAMLTRGVEERKKTHTQAENTHSDGRRKIRQHHKRNVMAAYSEGESKCVG